MRLLLVAATVIPIAMLAWLAVKILQQERDVERQRAREALEVAAGRLALGIDQRFAELEAGLGQRESLHLTAKGIEGRADPPLLYEPQLPGANDPPDVFTAGELEEFKNQNLSAAEAGYARLAASPDAAVRAGALLRLARVQRKRGEAAAALDAYTKLEELGTVPVGSDIASLIARQGRAKIFGETGHGDALRREAGDLARLLYSGNLPIDRATFDFYSSILSKWGAPTPPDDVLACTEAAVHLWETWRDGELPQAGRRIVREHGTPVLAIWAGDRLRVASMRKLQEIIAPLADRQRLHVSISDTEGAAILGNAAEGSVSIPPGESRLPFTIQAAALDANNSSGRTVILTGLTLAFLLMAAAAFTLYRVTTRELMLAQQQSDFVSAVSHEFRTPLTSMRHLTEMLVSRSVASEDRKAQYYELLANETERLHRMVETLLSFGRIEAGAYAFHLEPANLDEFVGRLVEEFRSEPAARDHNIIYEAGGALPSARIDREALTRALWNLLENAVKYSESGRTIRVFVRQNNGSALVGIEDQGIGIPAGEREKIFQKFVRGSSAKRSGIRGVGIGLALVQHIVEAHGGSVRVESEVGRGSTFIVEIPCPGF